MQQERLKLRWAWLMEIHLLPSGLLWRASIRLKLKTQLTDEAMTVVTFPDVDISCRNRHCLHRRLLTIPFRAAFQFESWIWRGVTWQSVTVGNYRTEFTQVRLDHVQLQIYDWQKQRKLSWKTGWPFASKGHPVFQINFGMENITIHRALNVEEACCISMYFRSSTDLTFSQTKS